MKFRIERNALLDALLLVQSVVEKKNTVQILSNILCTAKDQTLSLAATDLEVGVRVTLPAQVETEGRTTLSAKHFSEIVRELPSQPLSLTKKENEWVEIVSGKSKFNVVSLPADEYPTLPGFEEKEYFQARADFLSDMINKTQFAVSTDATRYHLNGVYVENLGNNLIRMTATDGHRLSFVDHEIFLATPEIKRGMIVPKKGLVELKKLMDRGEKTIGLAFDRGYFFAKTGTGPNSIYLFVRLIEGEYPDVKQVIPKAADRIVKINREDLIAALRRVSLLAHEKSKGVKLAFQPGLLTISSSNPDMGEAREELEVEYAGEAAEIGFNAKYLLDCLPEIQSGALEFRFKDRLSPGILQGAQQRNHSYIIMPMRI